MLFWFIWGQEFGIMDKKLVKLIDNQSQEQSNCFITNGRIHTAQAEVRELPGLNMIALRTIMQWY